MSKQTFVVNLFLKGRTKIVKVSASSCKEAERFAKKEFPEAEVSRVSSEPTVLDYFKRMKEGKKDD